MAEDFDILASRSVEPYFYRAPHTDNPKFQPREYQHAGVEYAINRNNAIIGDAPGVGKSAQGVLLSNGVGAKRTLVISPASLILNWEREIWAWSTIPNVRTYPIRSSRDGVSDKADYVILSYDMLRNPAIFHAVMSLLWDHVILDEAHYLKDPKGNRRTNLICAPDAIPSVAGRMTLLTGTLLPNQPIECYNAIRLVNWDAINRASLEDFRDFYYGYGKGFVRGRVLERDPVTGEERWVNKLHWSEKVKNVPKNLDDLQYRLRKHCMVRRLKEQVLHELPPLQWHPFPLALTTEIRAALKHPGWKAAERLYEMDADAFNRGIPVDGEVSTARRLLGEAKAPSVASYIDDLLHEGVEKVVVGAHHSSVLDILRKKLTPYGLAYMDGSTPVRKRQAEVDRFQTDPRVRVILGQMQVIGEGHTLTAAQDVVFAEPDWVPGKNQQLLERINRFGQQGDYTLGHIPVVPGTLDERVLGTAIEKDKHIYAALDAQ